VSLPSAVGPLERAIARTARSVARRLPRRAGAFERDLGDLAELLALREELILSSVIVRANGAATGSGR
jgi:hypothetical protein